MPKITIREEDLTSSRVDNITSNTVYIPGYAISGPVNTPVLCNTLAEFTSIFGSKPYRFDTNQSWPQGATGFTDGTRPSGYFAEAGSPDKSYLMAYELLKAGLPVYFERVFDSTQIESWKYSTVFQSKEGAKDVLKLTSVSIDSSNKNIVCSIEYDTTTKKYKLRVGRTADTELGTPEVKTALTEVSVSDMSMNGVVDNSGLVVINIVNVTGDGDTLNYQTGKEYTLSLPVTSKAYNFSVSKMYDYLNQENTYKKLSSRGDYSIKYITSGGYPTFEYNGNSITDKMLKAAAERGDATALIDHTPLNSRSLVGTGSVYESVKTYCSGNLVSETLKEPVYTYGAMYTPYALYNTTLVSNVELPGSFAYLAALANSVVSNANWYSVAGVSRGEIPGIVALSQNITDSIASAYTPKDNISINPILNVRPYGLVIWGNRTLKNNRTKGELTATSFMNIRQLVSDVKKVVYSASRRLTFEPNNDILWINFKSLVTPTLDEMLHDNGLTEYELKKQKAEDSTTLKARIILKCVEAVEDFDITISLTDSESTITE